MDQSTIEYLEGLIHKKKFAIQRSASLFGAEKNLINEYEYGQPLDHIQRK